jgi:hypothetical protein
MRVRRVRPKRVYLAFAATIAMMVFMPTPIGLQDIAALIARQPFVSDSVRQRLASPFGTIHAATFTMARPIGAIPQIPLYTFASFDPADPEITGSIGKSSRFLGAIDPEPQRIYPTVNRATKGDRLVPASPESVTAHPETPVAEPDEAPGEGSALEDPAAPDISLSLELRPQLPIALPPDQPEMPIVEAPQPDMKAAQTEGTPDFSDDSTAVTDNIFFGRAIASSRGRPAPRSCWNRLTPTTPISSGRRRPWHRSNPTTARRLRARVR